MVLVLLFIYCYFILCSLVNDIDDAGHDGGGVELGGGGGEAGVARVRDAVGIGTTNDYI